MYVSREVVCDWSAQVAGLRGFGGCSCASCRCGPGMGRHRGLGLFDTPWDLSTWGWQGWGLAALAGYALFSMMLTSGRAQKKISRSFRKRERRRERIRAAREGLREARRA